MNTARLFDDAISGNIDSFNREISDGALISLEHKTPSRNCILHVAAKSGQRQIMERVLDSLYPHSPLHETNCKGNTVLHIAASLGYLDVSELLITRAIDQEAEVKRLLLKAQNEEKNTALHLAVKHGHYDIVDLLIRKEPGLTSITNTAGESPLFLAVDRRFLKIALHFVRDILIRFPNAILKADDFGRTPLHYAAYFASLEVVNLFLENNNISLAYKLDKQGMSALHISAKKGHYDVMSAILQKFPFTCELLDNKGRTALHHAVESGSTNAVKILLSSVAFQDLINEQENDEGNTAMHLAAIKRRYKVLILLAGDRRVAKSATNKEGKTTADIIQLDNKQPTWFEIMELWRINIKQEVERQITEEQFADQNEGHVKESQRIEAAAKVQGGTGAANNIVDLNKELKKYNFLVMTLITTVTFAAAFQVPGGYDDHGKANLVKSKDFENFLIFDTLSFGSSATSLIIYFATPLIQKMSFLQNIVPPVTALLSTISLSSMILAFCAGVRAVLDEKSSLYSLIRTAIVYSLDIPLFLYGIICYIFIIPLTYWNKSFRQIISTVQIVIIISSSIYFKGARSLST
nr:ankyrin repeat-containing protein [Quercus suber]